MELSSRDKRINKHQPEIVSSQDQPIDEEENNGINYRQKRLPSWRRAVTDGGMNVRV